jgi:hypothetical protein
VTRSSGGSRKKEGKSSKSHKPKEPTIQEGESLFTIIICDLLISLLELEVVSIPTNGRFTVYYIHDHSSHACLVTSGTHRSRVQGATT